MVQRPPRRVSGFAASDSRPVNTRGKEMNFQPITIEIELPEETFGPISIAGRNRFKASVVSLCDLCMQTRCRSSRSLKICVRQHDAQASLCVKIEICV